MLIDMYRVNFFSKFYLLKDVQLMNSDKNNTDASFIKIGL